MEKVFFVAVSLLFHRRACYERAYGVQKVFIVSVSLLFHRRTCYEDAYCIDWRDSVGLWRLREATTISDNAANAFSITNGNPNGDWSYGQYTTLETPSSFSVYNTDVTDPPTGIQVWRNGSNSDPNVTYNPTSSAINAYNISWEPGHLRWAEAA